MAGHDINYLAVSGVLSQIGPAYPSPPVPPVNILGDFAGGGLVCFVGILLALVARGVSGKGQVVEANMVDGAGYLGSMPRLGRMEAVREGNRVAMAMWGAPRGENLLDGGCPYYFNSISNSTQTNLSHSTDSLYVRHNEWHLYRSIF